jgi:hypothetical protein
MNFMNISSYKNNGFVIVKNVIPKKNILDLRDKLMSEAPPNFVGHLENDYVTSTPELYKYQFDKNLIYTLKQIFGDDIYMMNDFNLQFNNPNNRGKDAGWHTDANSEQARYVPYLNYNNYQFCKVGIFLQENSIEFGGGIDVEIGGHHSYRDTNNRILNLILYRIDRLFLSKFRKRIRVPIEAGDCVIFDSRLPHASSKPLLSGEKIPMENKKITLYYNVAGNIVDAERFYLNSCIRVFTSDESASKFFTSYLRYCFPNSYPEPYIKSANSIPGSHIYSLSQDKAEVFNKLYQTLEE